MDASKFSGKAVSKKDAGFIGFRIIEIPLGLVREMVAKGMGGEGSKKLCKDYPPNGPCSDLTAVQVNEFDGALTIMKNPDGTYKQLTKQGM
jgi:hypothetical protein